MKRHASAVVLAVATAFVPSGLAAQEKSGFTHYHGCNDFGCHYLTFVWDYSVIGGNQPYYVGWLHATHIFYGGIGGRIHQYAYDEPSTRDWAAAEHSETIWFRSLDWSPPPRFDLLVFYAEVGTPWPYYDSYEYVTAWRVHEPGGSPLVLAGLIAILLMARVRRRALETPDMSGYS